MKAATQDSLRAVIRLQFDTLLIGCGSFLFTLDLLLFDGRQPARIGQSGRRDALESARRDLYVAQVADDANGCFKLVGQRRTPLDNMQQGSGWRLEHRLLPPRRPGDEDLFNDFG